jgi:hypothetical protein
MRDHKDIIAITCAIVISVVAACLLQLGDTTETPQPPMPTYFDYLVRVTAHNPNESHVGSGILVQHNRPGWPVTLFVLTSKMIFTPTDTSYDVLLNGVTYSAGMILKDEERGLVALDIPVNFGGGVEVDNAPNLPPDATAQVCSLDGDTRVTVQRYLTNPDWMILNGYVPGKSTGAPMITSDGHLAGIVIGVNTENAGEAFAVGNHAIRAFADAVVAGKPYRWEELEYPDLFPPDSN